MGLLLVRLTQHTDILTGKTDTTQWYCYWQDGHNMLLLIVTAANETSEICKICMYCLHPVGDKPNILLAMRWANYLQ